MSSNPTNEAKVPAREKITKLRYVVGHNNPYVLVTDYFHCYGPLDYPNERTLYLMAVFFNNPMSRGLTLLS